MIAVVGLVLFAAGGGLLFWGRKVADKNLEIMSTDTSTVAQVKEMATEIGKEIGAGSFRQRVELKGTLISDAPLKGELSGERCARFTVKVYRKFEEEVEHKDSNGNVHHRRETREESLSELTRETPAFLSDASGRIEIDLGKGNVDTMKTVDRFEPGSGAPTTLASFLHEALARHGHRHTLGYRYVETVVPLDRRVFVLGEATDEGGQLRVQAGEGGLTVSLKSEEELVKSNQTTVMATRVVAALCGLGGAFCVVKGLFL